MPTTAEQCVNHAINLEMCPCTSESCPRRGICCECIQAHAAKGGLSGSACAVPNARRRRWSGARRRRHCAQTARNSEILRCTWEPCANKAVSELLRNHFAGRTGRVACRIS